MLTRMGKLDGATHEYLASSNPTRPRRVYCTCSAC